MGGTVQVLAGTQRVDRWLRRGLLGILLGASLIAVAPASAATIAVNTTVDEFAAGPRCSLREAIWASNNDSNAQAPGCTAGAGTDLIRLPAGSFSLNRSGPTPAATAEDADVFGDLDVTAPASLVHTGFLPAQIRSNVGNERALHNLAGGSGFQMQGVTIENSGSTIGGGILNQGVLTVTGSTLAFNSAGSGGGLANTAGTASLVNSTLYGNSAGEDGGGVFVSGGSVNLRSVTLTNNSTSSGDGAGLFVFSSGPPSSVVLRDTLDAGNRDAGTEAHDCAKLGGSISSLGHNLIGNTNGCGYQAGPGDIRNRSAKVLGLGDFGGPTETVNLNKRSPAINHGTGCPGSDQRGVPRNLGGRCDIGAWELVRCKGVVVNRIGTNGAELLLGTSGPDGILALGGADTIRAMGGNDGLCGGGGRDRLEGGGGNDGLDGGPGRDTCLGGGGRNTFTSCERRR
jgi:CSLREA domain-containing protein